MTRKGPFPIRPSAALVIVVPFTLMPISPLSSREILMWNVVPRGWFERIA